MIKLQLFRVLDVLRIWNIQIESISHLFIEELHIFNNLLPFEEIKPVLGHLLIGFGVSIGYWLMLVDPTNFLNLFFFLSSCMDDANKHRIQTLLNRLQSLPCDLYPSSDILSKDALAQQLYLILID